MRQITCKKYTIDDIFVGQTASFNVKVSERTVDSFSRLTGDYSPLHTDAEFARKTQFRQKIAHGLLVYSYASTIVGMYLPGENAAILNHSARYLKPVRMNDKLTIKGTVASKEPLLGKIVLNITITNQRNETVTDGTISVIVNSPPKKGIVMSDIAKMNYGINFNGKVVLVTGASRGIGAATAKLFASHGAAVVVNYNLGKKDALGVVSDIAGSRKKAVAIKASVSQASEVAAMIKKVISSYGKIDILVNNAMSDALPVPFEKIEWDDMQRDIDVALKGAFNTTKAVLPVMLKNGYGKIINVTTVYSNSAPPPGFAKYVTAKTALLGFTRALAVEYAPKNIFFNVVSPGLTETDLGAHIPDWLKSKMAADVPQKRNAQPIDIAKTILVMASHYTDYVIGNQMLVCGGSVMI